MVVCESDNYGYLKQSIQSIIDQTLKPSELILIINGYFEAQNVDDLKNEFSNKIELGVYSLDNNYGLAYALNFGLSKCNFDLVARMDPDDISLPERFEMQYSLMLNNPHLAASSAWIEEFNEDLTESKGVRTTPLGDINIDNKYAKLRSPLNHIPAIIRKSIIIKIGGYPNFKKGQDYALWSLVLVKGYKLRNIGKVLAKVRSSSSKTDRRGIKRLYSEIPVIFFQYKISYLSLYEFIFSLTIRVTMRLLPYKIRKLVFKKLRSKAEKLKNIDFQKSSS